jgi:dTDP-glucose 4,6-dehydratase
LYGDGANVREWLHVDDHCRAVDLVLRQGRPGEIYNIGSGTELTNRELTARLLRASGAGWERVSYVPDRKGHDRRYSVSTRKIREELGFTPRVALDQGLADVVAWYRDNRSWWGQRSEAASTAL